MRCGWQALGRCQVLRFFSLFGLVAEVREVLLRWAVQTSEVESVGKEVEPCLSFLKYKKTKPKKRDSWCETEVVTNQSAGKPGLRHQVAPPSSSSVPELRRIKTTTEFLKKCKALSRRMSVIDSCSACLTWLT